MTRRELFKRAIGLAVAAKVAPALPAIAPNVSMKAADLFWPSQWVTSSYAPANTMYYLNYRYVTTVIDNPRRLGVITSID